MAQYADMNNMGGGFAEVERKERILREHCERVGRDPAEIERTASVGTIFIRDRRADAERACRLAFETNRADPWYPHAGTPEDIADELAPYLGIGYRHLIANFPAPYDEESVTRFATEVRELLDRQGLPGEGPVLPGPPPRLRMTAPLPHPGWARHGLAVCRPPLQKLGSQRIAKDGSITGSGAPILMARRADRPPRKD